MTELSPPNSRRDELLELAATMFAERGLRATTVRDIADSAGILSGSLYHHFDSKESIGDEILAGFLDEIRADYQDRFRAVEIGGRGEDVILSRKSIKKTR